MTARDIVQAALALPREERLQVIEELQASLEGEDPDFVAMINRRVADIDAGKRGTPAAEVFARLRARR